MNPVNTYFRTLTYILTAVDNSHSITLEEAEKIIDDGTLFVTLSKYSIISRGINDISATDQSAIVDKIKNESGHFEKKYGVKNNGWLLIAQWLQASLWHELDERTVIFN